MADKRKINLREVPDDKWSDAHEAELQRRIAANPDDWSPGDDEKVELRTFAEEFPAAAEEIARKKLGRPPVGEAPKRAVKLRLDADVIERFKAGGAGWQTRMNQALRKAAGLR
jgi:uncharacterized protein (DUF4415 family)